MIAFASVFACRRALAREDHPGMGHRQRIASFKNRLLLALVKFGVLRKMTAKLSEATAKFTARLAVDWPLTP
jgi:hypothetical protein